MTLEPPPVLSAGPSKSLDFLVIMPLTSAVVTLSLLSIATLSAAAPPFPHGGGHPGPVSNVSITSDGLHRSYLLSLPPAYHPGAPTPMILSYHGGNRNASEQLLLDQLTNPKYNANAIVVYPQGIDVSDPLFLSRTRRINILIFMKELWQGVPGVKTNDIQFTTDILEQVESRYNIDKSRIWVTGKSDGGGFANILACDSQLSARFAAFAPVSGAYYIDELPCYPSQVQFPCNPSRPDIPFLAFHGGNDTIISFQGGERKNECLPSIPHFIQEWARRDHLDSRKNSTKHLTSDTVAYSFGPTGLVRLVYDAVIGHDWPSTVPNDDNQQVGHILASFNATPIIMNFFHQHILTQ